jgi:AcrR family transcriptional regulator
MRERKKPDKKPDKAVLLDRCLKAFVQAGTLDVSLDHLARRVGISKRMLVHYFGGRENIEEGAIALLEARLRAQFAVEQFPPAAAPQEVLRALWDQTTKPESRGVLLLAMDLSKRAWSGSARARRFYEEQQRLWIELLARFIADRTVAEEVLQTFQGAVFAFLITGERAVGWRAIARVLRR